MKCQDRNINPDRFQILFCDHKGCGSKEDLQEDRFNNRVICTTCLNVVAAELALEGEREEINRPESEYTYAEIRQGRI